MQKKKSCELIKITNIINNSDFLRDIFDKLYTHSLHGYPHNIKNKLINNYYTDFFTRKTVIHVHAEIIIISSLTRMNKL